MELSTGQIIFASGMVVVSGVLASRGRRFWMLYDAGATLLIGLLDMAIPWILFGSMTRRPVDDFHCALGRAVGASMVASAITFGMTRNTSDMTVHHVLISSRIMGILMNLLAHGYAHMQYPDLGKGGWTQEHVGIGMVAVGCSLLGYLYHFAKLEHFGCFGQRNDRVSAVLRIDGFIVQTVALVAFAFPEMWLSQMMNPKAVDGIHLHMMRMYGTVNFMIGMVSSWAPVFLHDEDKRNVLLARIVENALVLVVDLFHITTFYHLPTVLASQAFVLLFLGMLVWGYLAPTEEKKKE